jgi:hypothetical protein
MEVAEVASGNHTHIPRNSQLADQGRNDASETLRNLPGVSHEDAIVGPGRIDG